MCVCKRERKNVSLALIDWLYLVFNMINNVNVQETEERIEKFRLENKYVVSFVFYNQSLNLNLLFSQWKGLDI